MLLSNLGTLSAVIAVAAMAALSPLLSAGAAAQPYSPPQGPVGSSYNPLGTTTPIHVVSLRVGPNGAAPVIGVLHPGTPVRVIGSANYGWMQVISAEGSGWAYGSYFASGMGGIGRSDTGTEVAKTASPADGGPPIAKIASP